MKNHKKRSTSVVKIKSVPKNNFLVRLSKDFSFVGLYIYTHLYRGLSYGDSLLTCTELRFNGAV